MKIRTTEVYRDIGLHDFQDERRLKIVRAEIDAVHQMTSIRKLFDYALDVGHAPEARLYAIAKLRAAYDLAVQERRTRPDIDMTVLGIVSCGLQSEGWRDREFFGCIVERGERSVPRARPLPPTEERIRS